MTQSLELTEDRPGERLVLTAPPSGIVHAAREAVASAWRAFSSFAKEIRGRPRSPRELLISAGMALLLVVLVLLVALACVMAVVGAALVVVLYVIGAWLVAWWIVREAALLFIQARERRRERAGLTRLSFDRNVAEVAWTGRGKGARSFASLSSIRVAMHARSREPTAMLLTLVGSDEASATRLRFGVEHLDREEECVDFSMRVARVLGWQAYAVARDPLLRLEVELRPVPPPDRSHPFRSLGGAPRFHAIDGGDAHTTAFREPAPTGFREPAEPTAPFQAGALSNVTAWRLGELVTLRAAGGVRWGRIILSLAGALLVALALAVSVILMINITAGLSPLEVERHARLSFAGRMGLFTAVSGGLGMLLALRVAMRSARARTASFDWGKKQLTARDESGAHVIPFAHIAELLLTESASGRFLLGVATRGGATMVVLEAEPSSGPASTLALTIDLARALGVAWRCVSDAP